MLFVLGLLIGVIGGFFLASLLSANYCDDCRARMEYENYRQKVEGSDE